MERSLLTQPTVSAEGVGAASSPSILKESISLGEADPRWRHPGGALEPPRKHPQLPVRLRTVTHTGIPKTLTADEGAERGPPYGCPQAYSGKGPGMKDQDSGGSRVFTE